MSTRCQIGIYEEGAKDLNDWCALLYRHCDGYPSGVLPDIQPFLANFKDKRGLDDTEYLAGALVTYLTGFHRGKKKEIDILAVGVCRQFHGDIEFFYAVSPSHLDVYSCGGFRSSPENWNKIMTLKIGEIPEKMEED